MRNELDYSLEKASLKRKLLAIILLESSKPYKKMNSALVTECVDFLWELEGKEGLTKEETERRISEIPFAGKSVDFGSHIKNKIKAKRLALIAAIIAILFALFGVVAVSMGSDSAELIRKIGNAIVEMFNGETVESGNVTLIKPDETKYYDSIEELLKEEEIDILYPGWLPENVEITSVMYSLEGEIESYRFLYNNIDFGLSVSFNQNLAEDVKLDCQSIGVNGYVCYYFVDEGFAQASFEYKNNRYTVNADTEENLFGIIQNLKEIN